MQKHRSHRIHRALSVTRHNFGAGLSRPGPQAIAALARHHMVGLAVNLDRKTFEEKFSKLADYTLIRLAKKGCHHGYS